MLAKALTHDGLHVVEAKNGEEATTMLRVMRPHVVLLDAMLPVVHGFEICASLKRSKLKSIPVIMISAVYRGWEQARDIQEVHGADFFVEKPFELTYIRRLVADVLKRPASLVPRVDGTMERIDEIKAKYDELAQRGLYFSADAFVEQWIDLDPFDGRAWLERGNICAQGGDLVGAMAAYEAAVVYEPSLLVGHLALATVYERLGFIRRARTTWLRARELTPDKEMHQRIDLHLAGTK
jgi:CheY-like chemotaxis protein